MTHGRRLPALAAVCLAALCVRGAAAQSRISLGLHSRAPSTSSPVHLRADQALVLIPVAVSDRREHVITGLERGQFHLFDNKVEQTITHFSMEDAPLAAGLVFDVSTSMGRKLRRSRLSAHAFFQTANPEDEFLLVTFSDRPRLAVPLTTDTGKIESRLASQRPKGATALLDAIYLAISELKKSAKPRKALLVISDGGDNNSRYSEAEIKHLLRESDILVYGIGIYESADSRGRTPEEFYGPTLLSQIAELTGGREFAIDDPKQLPDAAAKIGRELRNYYMLGFSPAPLQRDGKYHRIRVKLTPPRGMSSLQARWRQGYYAPTE